MDYASSGVNIDAGNKAVDLIKSSVKTTFSPQVLGGLGGFAACYELPKGYEEPVLVSCTDGVGTKLKLAIDSGKLDTVGIDLVAMCVNDMICGGAKPLYFLDYIACHALNPEQMKTIVDGIVEGCLQSGCSLVGGEMAEMNDMYQPGDFDLAGFSVGVVEKSQMIDGSNIASGQYVYGLLSSGVHSNGYSLLRRVLTPEVCASRGISLDLLLEPTRIYVDPVLDMIKGGGITGLAHITGGGLSENVRRILPDDVRVEIDLTSITVPEIFSHIQEAGDIDDVEMYRVFNMGIGMIVISERELPENDLCRRLGQVSSVSGIPEVFVKY